MKSVSKTGRLLSVAIHLIAISVVFFIPTVQAATFCVSDATGLHDALTQAAGNGEDDIIRVQQGTYVGNFVYTSHKSNSLTLQGGYTAGCTSRTIEPTNTILDGNAAGNVLVISTDKTTPVKIEGLTFQNGIASQSNTDGGALYFKASGGDLQVDRCVFVGNSASEDGGGVYAYADSGALTLTFTYNTFTENSASSEGGGVYGFASQGALTLTLTNNTFMRNSAWVTNGGGVYAHAFDGRFTLVNNSFLGNSVVNSGAGGGLCAVTSNGTLTLTNNTFVENSASYGGGVYAFAWSSMNFTSNTISNNSANDGGGVYADGCSTGSFANNAICGNGAGDLGGGIYSSIGTVTLSNNTISGNGAKYGGGVYTYASTAVFINNIISCNRAVRNGGGVCTSRCNAVVFTNNTLVGNSGLSGGGGICTKMFSSDEIARIYNNILWANTGSGGTDLWLNNHMDGVPCSSPVELFNNDFDQSSAGTYIQDPFPIDPSNLDDTDPFFVSAENGDYHLTTSSPCINAGTAEAPDLPSTDKDGNSRISGGIPDMGAYEFTIFSVFNVEPSGSCGGKRPCYSTIQDAIDAVFLTGTIRISEGTHSGIPLVNTADKEVTLEGGWDAKFQKQSGTTILRNAPKALQGSIILRNLNIKP
ncbi:MAG: right-handed parallel beta-helix repeat-containing protein [Deltaproteobacteria bacterium]|nr:right-handed parallel beta-helix repeat-containing protein [Deltaproteobacteria bacterium]MCF8120707.1 right-handed parallel beta-helix repeat-containing protein [Deltaproteobacteria bacterium]